jgi:iron complex transport system ATP-binding protein
MTDGLAIRGLDAGYGRKRVVKHVTLPELAPGEVVALVGPNAAGKSTLMRALAGLVPATGEALLDGVDLMRLGLAERAERVAFMPQSLPGGVALGVLEGVLTALKAAPCGEIASNAALRRRAFAALERFGIERLALEPLDRLSGGQRQLASLAQAAVREPRLLLLDEPTSALDLAHQIRAMRLVRSFAQDRDAIVLVVLHDLALACRWADRVAVLADGAVAAFGAPAEAITSETLRLAYRVEARVEEGPDGRLRVEVEDALPAAHRDAS